MKCYYRKCSECIAPDEEIARVRACRLDFFGYCQACAQFEMDEITREAAAAQTRLATAMAPPDIKPTPDEKKEVG